MKLVAILFLFLKKVIRRILIIIYRPLFNSYGKNFIFDPYGMYSFKNITVGDDVYIGPGAKILCSNTYIIMGNKIMLGPNVSFLAGNHNTKELGIYMYDQKQKNETDDMPIIIEDDVWISANVTILKGVTIGRGSILGAGAIVTKSIPSYSVVVGMSANNVMKRFTNEEILIHEKQISRNR